MAENINEKQQDDLKEEFDKRREKVTEDDIAKAIKLGKEKIEDLERDVPKALLSLWHDVKDMWKMLRDYWSKKYTTLPFGTVSAVAVGLLYLISPFDIIFDFIPFVGYLDDAFVLTLALKIISQDLEKYRIWKRTNEVENINE
jgi:uncharacterized membrane protein YkvA (DUF1232 family)